MNQRFAGFQREPSNNIPRILRASTPKTLSISTDELQALLELKEKISQSILFYVLRRTGSPCLKAAISSKHSGAISQFHREFVKSGFIPVEVAKFIDIAFDLRNKSDYRDFVAPDEERVRELLKDSGVFIQTVESALQKIL